jgi:hypothetical protein
MRKIKLFSVALVIVFFFSNVSIIPGNRHFVQVGVNKVYASGWVLILSSDVQRRGVAAQSMGISLSSWGSGYPTHFYIQVGGGTGGEVQIPCDYYTDPEKAYRVIVRNYNTDGSYYDEVAADNLTGSSYYSIYVIDFSKTVATRATVFIYEKPIHSAPDIFVTTPSQNGTLFQNLQMGKRSV